MRSIEYSMHGVCVGGYLSSQAVQEAEIRRLKVLRFQASLVLNRKSVDRVVHAWHACHPRYCRKHI
jgi:hypothetical protein